NNQQLAVYHGQQKSNTTCSDTGRRVYMYPFEYLTYGRGDVSNFSTRADGTKEYRIADHLGSTRVGVTSTGVDARYNYEVFGKQQPVTGVYTPREGYIGKEKDIESQTFDFGVRKYEDETGRFLSIDPLWEKYPKLTPYEYGANSPLINSDPTGDTIKIQLMGNTPKSYIARTQAMLDKLRGMGGYVGHIMNQLDRSKNIHVIQVTSGPEARSFPYSPSPSVDADENAQNGVGAGSRITVNPFYHQEDYKGESGPGYITLFGELCHSFRFDKGIADIRTWFVNPGAYRSIMDEQIVHGFMENQARRQAGIPLRLTYGGVAFPFNVLIGDPATLLSRSHPTHAK
ncbi:MAG: RHS repeat-associated core domain-containing protein, partial [Bacteroidota bacterium]